MGEARRHGQRLYPIDKEKPVRQVSDSLEDRVTGRDDVDVGDRAEEKDGNDCEHRRERSGTGIRRNAQGGASSPE